MANFLKNLFLAGGVVTLIAGVAQHSNQSVQTPPASGVVAPQTIDFLAREGYYPQSNVDRILLQKIVELESQYKRNDLGEEAVRTEHLQLCATLFAQSSMFAKHGIHIDPKDLTSKIRFLIGSEYGRNSAFSTDFATANTNFNIDSDALKNIDPKYAASFPNWSALSEARLLYFELFTETAGYQHPRFFEKEKKPIIQFPGLNAPAPIDGYRGFIIFAFDETIKYDTTNKIMANYMNAYLLRNISQSHPLNVYDKTARLLILFSQKPELEKEFVAAFAESNVDGLAEKLAHIAKYNAVGSEDAKRWGTQVLVDVAGDGVMFNQFMRGIMPAAAPSIPNKT